MRTLLTLIFLSYFSNSIFAQDTLRHFPKNTPLTAYIDSSNGKKCGYITGMNCSMYEAFAERYDISDSAEVTAVISYHKGNFRDMLKKAAIEIYSVNSLNLPDSLLVSRQQTFRNLLAYGNPVSTPFFNPVKVGKSFFVGINFLDYAHYQLTDTIAVLSTYHLNNNTNGSTDNFGRNVLRVHHYDFVDLYSKTGLRINLALFPVIKFKPIISGSSKHSINKNNLLVYAPFPNPCINEVNIPFKLNSQSEVSIQLINIQGEVLMTKEAGRLMVGEHTERLNISEIPSGTYYALITTEESTIGVTIVK